MNVSLETWISNLAAEEEDEEDEVDDEVDDEEPLRGGEGSSTSSSCSPLVGEGGDMLLAWGYGYIRTRFGNCGL